jgi:probable F420-dependent oxidoreductase
MKIRIGLGAVSVKGPADPGADLVELLDLLETHHVDSLWLSDVVSSGQVLDPLVGIAYAAARTSHLKLGTGVLVLPGRGPGLVAKQLASLAALAPARILPVFGLQAATPRDQQHYGVPAAGRGAYFDETIAVVRALLTQPSVSHHGAFFDLDDARIAPLPPKALDLWLGGRLPVGMRRIGRLADGWLGSFVTPDEAEVCRRQIQDAAREAEREIEDDHYGTNLLVALDDSSVEELVARTAGRRPDLGDPSVLVCRGWSDVREQVAGFVDVGLCLFVVRPAGPVASLADFVDAFASEVMVLQN